MQESIDKKNRSLPTQIDKEWQKTGNLVVLFTNAIASQMGLSAPEFECQTIIREHGPLTIGELARYCNMTTGGMTKLVDRLEKQGFARRVPDPQDRRRVVIEDCLSEMQIKKIVTLYAPLSSATRELLSSMNASEQSAVHSYLKKLNDILEQQISR